jgi:hypothetical protein
LEQHLRQNTIIDAGLQAQITAERQRWRDVLDRILQTVKLCATQNLPLRGHRESLQQSENPGNFLAVLKLIARYDTVAAQHLDYAVSNPRSVSYLSHETQNEFIELMGNAVRQHIIDEIRQAKYFSMMFDTTPDLAHREQMSEVIRYVHIHETNVEIKESFIDFFEIHEKTSEALATEILSKLDADGLRVEDCRGQTYDNAAVMAGRRTGVQTRIREKNPRALYVPCDSHSLNLVGVHAAHVDPVMVTFFGTIERIFTFFASSTHRWEVMKQHVELAIKRDCDTRWSSKCDAVEAVCMQIDSVVDALEHLQDNACENADIRPDAGILLRSILTFNFLVLLPFWRSVLQAINRIQKRLQDPKMNFRDAADDILGLKEITRTRGEQFCVDAMQDGMRKCEEWNVEINLRTRRRKKMQGELEADAALTTQEETRRVMKSALDTIAAGLDTRFQQLEYLHKTFGFLLDTETLMTADAIDLDDLKRKCTDIATAFPDDVDSARLVDEIQDCRILVSRRVGVDVTPLGILKFIVSFGGNDVFPNLNHRRHNLLGTQARA